MAIKTFYWKNAVPSGATLHRSLQDGGSAPTTASTTTGWVADQKAIAQSCIQNGGSIVSRTDGQWGTTLQPSAAPSQTIGDGWRSENTLSGVFANSNWVFTFGIRSTVAYVGRLKLAVRLYRCTGANGTGATQMTAGRVASSATTANLSTSADTTVTVTWTPGATHTLTDEYLFITVGIEVTAAGSANTQDVIFRVGSAYTVVTPNFVPLHATSGVLVGAGKVIAGSAALVTPPITGPQSYMVAPGLYLADASDESYMLAPGVYVAGVGVGGGVTHDTSGGLVGPGVALAGTASSATTRSTSGALIGAGKVIVGSAARTGAPVSHATSGALVGSGKILAGSAVRGLVGAESYMLAPGIYLTDAVDESYIVAPGVYVTGTGGGVAHVTTGTLAGSGAALAGIAERPRVGRVLWLELELPAPAHATTGALIGTGKVITGTAARMRAHATSGVLTGPGAIVAGTAQHRPKHTTTGVLVGSGSTLSGTAARTRAHATSGALVGVGKVISGVAARIRIHTSTGALVGTGKVIAGLASRSTPGAAHATSGALAANATLSGVAHHKATHVTSGALVGTGKVISGTAARTRNHATSGVLAGAGATLAGVARHQAKHVTAGVLAGVGKVVSGSAARMRAHATSGVVVGAGKVIVGSAARLRVHAASGTLAGVGKVIVGSADHSVAGAAHATSGALVGPGAALAGTAAHKARHATSGTLAGPGSTLAGLAARTRAHSAAGVLVGPGRVLSGIAFHSVPGPHPTSGALFGAGAVVAGMAVNGVVVPGPGFSPGPGAGKRRKRRKSVVEIDGEQFTVWDEGEAVALLEHARELAEQQAASAAKSALNKARKLRRVTGRMPTLEVAVPELKFVSGDTDVRALVAQFQEAIDRLYLTTAREVEIAYYLRRKQQDDDDEEEAITMLLLH